jgi:sensor domain CHASE-containing protein
MGIMTIVLVAMAILMRTLIFSQFNLLDENQAITRVRVGRDLLENEISNMQVLVRDWGRWNDLYNFAQGENESFPKENITLTGLEGLKIQLMMVYDNHRNLKDILFVSDDFSQQLATPAALVTALAESGLIEKDLGAVSNDGVPLLVGGRPILIATQTILTSEAGGPPAGVLVMGRWLTQTIIDRWGKVAGSQLIVRPEDEGVGSQANQNESGVAHLTETTIDGEVVVADNQGKPLFELATTIARDGYRQGWRLYGYLLVAAGVLCYLAGAVVWWYWVRSWRQAEKLNQLMQQQVKEMEQKNQLLENNKLVLELQGQEMVKKNQDLEKLNQLMVGRELKMVELKEENQRLKVRGDVEP